MNKNIISLLFLGILSSTAANAKDAKADVAQSKPVFRLSYIYQVDGQPEIMSSVILRDKDLTPIVLINSVYSCFTRGTVNTSSSGQGKELVCAIRNEAEKKTLVQVGTIAICDKEDKVSITPLIIREDNRVHKILLSCFL